MTKLPEAQFPEQPSTAEDDFDVPKTRKSFVPLGKFLDLLCS